jgi:hypothetical protein
VVALPKGCMDIFVSTLGENLNAEHFMWASKESSLHHDSMSLLLSPSSMSSPTFPLLDPTKARPGKITIHCIRHADESEPLTPLPN